MRTRLIPFAIVALCSLCLLCLAQAHASSPRATAGDVRPHSDVPDTPSSEPVADDLAAVLDTLGDPAYVVAQTDAITIEWGMVHPIAVTDFGVQLVGEALEAGEVLGPGLYVVCTPLGLVDGANDPDPLTMAAGEVLSVTGPVAQEGSVTCKNGYYACCYVEKNSGGKKKARCRPDAEDDADCDAGGKGSSACAWAVSKLSPVQ